MKTEKSISKVFEDAVAERIKLQTAGKDTTYLDGVTAALGWALEEYEDSPIE